MKIKKQAAKRLSESTTLHIQLRILARELKAIKERAIARRN